MPKVSIIIPFNNVEDYIKQCLDSVLNQTLTDIEIILINDASKDNSRNIAQEYANKDARIKILDIETRKGQGYARNRAMEIAQGEYIGFVDSDDWVKQDMFEKLYNSAKTNNTDITMCQSVEYDDLNNKYLSSDLYSLAVLNKFENCVFSAEDTKFGLFDINVALWNKIYKKEFLFGLGEKFPEGYIYEDLPFFFGTYLPAKRINIVWETLYYYRINRKNSTMQQFNNKILDRPPMVSLTYEKIKAFPFLDNMRQEVQAWIIDDLFHRYSLIKEGFHQEFFFLMKKTFQNLDIQDIEDDYWKTVYHFDGYLKVLNCSFKEFNQYIFNKYLDIREIENQMFFEINNSKTIQNKFDRVYDDLHKNYNYTEELTNQLDKKFSDWVYKVQTDNKYKTEYLDKVYQDLESKTEQLAQVEKAYQTKLNEIKKEFEEDTEQKILEIKHEFDKQLEIQEQKHKEEIEKLKYGEVEISVIVPVYNIQDYIRQCLNSIINQTFKDIEIICVNDGSTDASREILEEYAKKDNRIKIIDKENGGLSSARNAGMKVARGKFISFIDSDDWVDTRMLEKLHNNITALNTDISICAVHQYDETKQKIDDSNPYYTLEAFDSSFDNKVFSYQDTIPFIMDVCVMAWNKLYRKSFLDECKAVFPDGLIFEDGPFFFSIFFKTRKISIIRDLLYYYRINRTGSIVQKGGKQFLDIIDVVNLMLNSIKDLEIFDDIKYDFFAKKADDIIYRYDLINLNLKNTFSKKFKKQSQLLNEHLFNFAYINETFPITYKSLCTIKHKTSILSFYWRKLVIRFMYKVMQVLYTEENIYYFKFWSLKFRLKKRPNICDIWYEDDKIFVVLFMTIKFHFIFEYSKLEKR